MIPSTAAVRLLAGDKEPVRIATTANITLSGLQTIDGVALTAGDRVLVKDQTSATQNGIYTASEGSWRRAPDSNSARVLKRGMKVHIQEGTTLSGQVWALATDAPDLGDDDIQFELYLTAGMESDINDNAVAAALAAIAGPLEDTLDEMETRLVEAVSARPAYGPVSGSVNFLGDSLFTSAHVSADHTISELLKANYGWSSVNVSAVSGRTVADQASNAFAMTPSTANPAYVWLLTNDKILDTTDRRSREQVSAEIYKAILFHLAIPNSKKVTGQAMTVAAGSWSNVSSAISTGATTSTTNGSVKRATVYGRHVVVCGLFNNSSNGTFTVTRSNANLASETLDVNVSNKTEGTILSNESVNYGPFVRVYKDLGASDDTPHVISVGVTSATGAGNDVFISYVAGLTGSPSEVMPLVVAANLHEFSAAGNTAQSITVGRNGRFNSLINAVLDEAIGLGLWIVPADVKKALDDAATLLSGDGVHPGNTGNEAAADAFIAATDGATTYRLRRAAELNQASLFATRGRSFSPGYRPVFRDGGWRSMSPERASVFVKATKGGASQGITNNTDTVVAWPTVVTDPEASFSSNTWTPKFSGPARCNVSIGFTAGVDAQIYKVMLYRSGSVAEQKQMTASGTAAFTLSHVFDFYVTEGDTFQIYVNQVSGGSATIDGDAAKTHVSFQST